MFEFDLMEKTKLCLMLRNSTMDWVWKFTGDTRDYWPGRNSCTSGLHAFTSRDTFSIPGHVMVCKYWWNKKVHILFIEPLVLYQYEQHSRGDKANRFSSTNPWVFCTFFYMWFDINDNIFIFLHDLLIYYFNACHLIFYSLAFSKLFFRLFYSLLFIYWLLLCRHPICFNTFIPFILYLTLSNLFLLKMWEL